MTTAPCIFCKQPITYPESEQHACNGVIMQMSRYVLRDSELLLNEADAMLDTCSPHTNVEYPRYE